jgi:hypothetical protein
VNLGKDKVVEYRFRAKGSKKYTHVNAYGPERYVTVTGGRGLTLTRSNGLSARCARDTLVRRRARATRDFAQRGLYMHGRRFSSWLSWRKAAVLATIPLLVVGLFLPLGESARADDAAGPTPSGIVSSVNGLWAVVDDLVSSPAVLDYDHPDLTVTGRLRLYDPVSKTYVAHSGGYAAVNFEMLTRSAPVAEDGSFTVTVPAMARIRATPWTARLVWVPDAATKAAFGEDFPVPAALATWPVPATQSFWRLRLDQSKFTVKAPAQVLISGTLERLVHDVWTPQPKVSVYVTSTTYGTHTDAKGRFAFTWPVDTDVVHGSIVAGDFLTQFTTYEARPLAVVDVDVIPTSKLTLDFATVSKWRVFRARGRLSYDLTAAPRARNKVLLQRSADGKTGWTTVHSMRTALNGTYDESVQLADVSGHYRVAFPGSSTVQASNARGYQLSRRQTRIASFRFSPTKLKYDDPAKVRGVIQVRTAAGTWVKLGKRVKVDIVRQSSKTSPYHYVTKRWTRSTGAFSFTVRPHTKGYWSVIWRTNSTTLVNAVSPRVRVSFI